MITKDVNIDFNLFSETIGKSMELLVREKAMKAGSTIVYREGDFLVEDNPSTGEKNVLKYYPAQTKK